MPWQWWPAWLGTAPFGDIAFGRYHRSRVEERFFLSLSSHCRIDAPSPSGIGPEAVHRFLGEVFRLAPDPIDASMTGDIYQYVGDEVVITMDSSPKGETASRPLACFFAIERALGTRGAPLRPRASARCRAFGPRCTPARSSLAKSAAVGVAIVYHGDVMNTTSRIEQATRDLKLSVPFSVRGRIGTARGSRKASRARPDDIGLQAAAAAAPHRCAPMRGQAKTLTERREDDISSATRPAEPRHPADGLRPRPIPALGINGSIGTCCGAT